MAEVTVDLACKMLTVERKCRTHLEPLPGSGEDHYHYLGARLEKIEIDQSFSSIICECELTTRQEIEKAIIEGDCQNDR